MPQIYFIKFIATDSSVQTNICFINILEQHMEHKPLEENGG
jgi:hypothetical protein